MRAAGRRTLAAASTAAAVLALAAPGLASTLETSACVPNFGELAPTPDMTFTGTGYTPGSLVTVKVASSKAHTPAHLTSATADLNGNFTATSRPPSFVSDTRQLQTFYVGAGDNVNPANAATTSFKQVRVGYTTNPATGPPRRSSLHTVRGFPIGRRTYLHFRFAGRTVRSVKLGRTVGPCGIVSRRMSLLPTPSRLGLWTVYVDQKSRYARSTPFQLSYTFPVGPRSG